MQKESYRSPEPSYERKERARKRRYIQLILLAGLLLLWLVSCTTTGKPFYSTGEIEAMLAERYGIPFTVELPAQRSRGRHERVYRVTSPRYPELVFTAADGWTEFSWSPGYGGVPPTPSFSRHYLRDDCRAVVWNRCAVPLLEPYGLAGLAVPEGQSYGGMSANDPSLPRYLIPCTDDMDGHVQTLCGLLSRLADLPLFRDAPEAGADFGVPVEVSAAPDSPLDASGTVWLSVGQPCEEAELREQLEMMKANAADRLLSTLRRAGIAEFLLEDMALPVPGEDFLVTEELTVKGRPAMFSLDENWRELLPLLRAVSGREQLELGRELRCYGTYPAAGKNCLCIVTSATVTTRYQDNALVMDHVLLADTDTGRLYQYGYSSGEYAVLARSAFSLPQEVLDQLLALPRSGETEQQETEQTPGQFI